MRRFVAILGLTVLAIVAFYRTAEAQGYDTVGAKIIICQLVDSMWAEKVSAEVMYDYSIGAEVSIEHADRIFTQFDRGVKNLMSLTLWQRVRQRFWSFYFPQYETLVVMYLDMMATTRFEVGYDPAKSRGWIKAIAK